MVTPEQKLQQRIARASRAKDALEEFIGPTFETVRDAYYDRIAEITAKEPWAHDKVIALMTAVRVCQEVQGQVEAIVAYGAAAKQDLNRAQRIEKIPQVKRKILGL